MVHVRLMILSVVLAFTCSLAVWADETELPGVSVEYSSTPDGQVQCRSLTSPSGNGRFYPEGIYPRTPAMPDTTVLWVDRNHMNAIAEDVFISGDGMNIFAGWWLNNERVSYYRTLASETPVWFASYVVDWEVSVGGSFDASALAANGSGAVLKSWDKMSSMPNWTFSWPSGYSGASSEGVDVSKDGSRVAAVASMSGDGLLYVFDASTGDTVYTRHFNPTRGLYGVDISADGHVVVVSTYDMIFIWEDGNSRGTLGNYGQTTARTSGDGSVVVTGDFNGYARAFVWNPGGPYYELVVNSYTGHPWVTAVGVSEDGSTVMAGTFQYSPANAGKVLLYDTTSSTPLWEYANYGDYVASVALSYDGSRAVCGSWGQLSATYGEVLSVFERSSAVPIFSLMDDIDEPGSIFTVAISDSGDYVAAGGKAVHAREFGNGGQVYAIIIGEPLASNVATSSIDSPGPYLLRDVAVAPQATFANYGQASETFYCHYEVYDSLGAALYSDSQQVVGLGPGLNQQVLFSSTWTPTEYGPYDVVAYTVLPGDGYPGDDTLKLPAECMHDARATSIKPPFPEVTVRMSLTPVVTVKNEGSYVDTVTCYLSIEDSLGMQVYADTEYVYTLPPDSSYGVQLSPWIPDSVGVYTAIAWTGVRDEYRPSNDTAAEVFDCTYEIIYDDGGAESYYIVSSEYHDNKFVQRFTPTIEFPYYLTGARVWVNGTDEFELSVHADSVGLPGEVLVGPDTVATSSAPGWVVETYPDYALEPLADFWLQIHWLPSSPAAPGVGADAASPREFRSWWYWDNPSDPGWHNWTAHDWMIRATVMPHGVGVEESGGDLTARPASIFRLHQNSPNPFSDATSIRFDLGSEEMSMKPCVQIFDAGGRLMTRIPLVGETGIPVGRLQWTGSDSQGKKLPSGVYFLKLEAGEKVATKKMVILR
jgi:hypothetical protein